MKNLVSILFMLSFILYSATCFSVEKNDDKNGEQSAMQTLQIVSSPELNDLATNWLAGFGILHPEQKIVLSCQTEVTPLKEGNLYLLKNNSQTVLSDKSAWKMVIGHDLVVPVINSKNPFIEEINRKGLTAEDFARFISEDSNWSMIIEGASKTSIQCYIADDQVIIGKISEFTKTDPSAIKGTKVTSPAKVISFVQNNVNAIGFCSLNDAINPENNGFAGQISIVPVDKNRNGRIDNFENIYTNPESLSRGAWIGKYPRELCGEIYALSTAKPTNKAALSFLSYVSGDGQDYIKKSGYSILSSVEKTANMLVLTDPVPPSETGNKSTLTPLSRILIVVSLVLIILTFILLIFKRKKQSAIDSDDIEITPALNENSIAAPRGLYYGKTHTWAFMEQDGLVRIGIDDFLKNVTGTITQLKMKSPGEKVRKGEEILSIIRNGKQLNLYSPVSGFIRKQNTFLIDTPTKINILPYTDGWVYKIEPTNWIREVRFLFMSDKYKEWLEDEFARLKDFLALSANINRVVYDQIVLQDGGELKINILADLEPKVWEEFQTRFIDTSK